MSGTDLDLSSKDSDTAILGIDSPRSRVGGPYVVIHKNVAERWAIVALEWEGEPRLGMRWFWSTQGNPTSSGHPTWFIIPDPLTHGILSSLPIRYKLRYMLDEFLCGRMKGDDLKEAHLGSSPD